MSRNFLRALTVSGTPAPWCHKNEFIKEASQLMDSIIENKREQLTEHLLPMDDVRLLSGKADEPGLPAGKAPGEVMEVVISLQILAQKPKN